MTNAQAYEASLMYAHNNPPPPLNPDYDPNHDIWWPVYIAKIHAAKAAGMTDHKERSTHFNQWCKEAKQECGLTSEPATKETPHA